MATVRPGRNKFKHARKEVTKSERPKGKSNITIHIIEDKATHHIEHHILMKNMPWVGTLGVSQLGSLKNYQK